MAVQAPAPPIFDERPRERIVPDAYRFAVLPLAASALAAALGWSVGALLGVAAALWVLWFFRNPERVLPGGERDVVAPADGRVIEAGEVEEKDGAKWQRVAIFLSVFDVHVNRAPVAGRVEAVQQRSGNYAAAFASEAHRNARTELMLRTESGESVRVVQIVGWVARRIICHPRAGEWLARGARYGLIRFGSRTDVYLPLTAQLCVERGERVRGGNTVIARLGD